MQHRDGVLYISNTGDVRDGPFDKLIEHTRQNLNGETADRGFLPFICQLNDDDEVCAVEPWPEENPYIKAGEDAVLTGTIESEGLSEFYELYIAPMWETMKRIITAIQEELDKYPYRRSLHLALHGKPRTRKKNQKRIERYFKKRMRKTFKNKPKED